MRAGCFPEPVWESQLGGASRGVEYGHDIVVVLAPYEDVEILCIALDAGVVLECIGATDEKRRVGFLQSV